MMPLVKILLSTYNGEKFLNEQLQSLRDQTYSNLIIEIRDDGSKDKTIEILNKSLTKMPNLKVSVGKNIGPMLSFFDLLAIEDDQDVMYYAFCDQDDIWMPTKIERAIEMLENYKSEEPLMYCSSYIIYNNISKKCYAGNRCKIIPGFQNALVENIAIGCSIVLNKSARNLLISKKPQNAVMHDAWCYLVVSALGTVLYDTYPSLYYRQHLSNVIGAKKSIWEKWKKRIILFKENRESYSKQVKEFSSLFSSDIDEKKLVELNAFLNNNVYFRLMAIFNAPFYRQSFLDNIIFKLLYLLYII